MPESLNAESRGIKSRYVYTGLSILVSRGGFLPDTCLLKALNTVKVASIHGKGLGLLRLLSRGSVVTLKSQGV